MPEKLLIVDDEADTLRLVALMLERQGYEVLTAINGSAALEVISQEKPDLVLLDVMMPEMDGYEVARRLRADPETDDIPIIMFTAKTQVEDKITGLEAGADAYLTKPTQPRELFAQVKAVLARVQMARNAQPSPAATNRGQVIGVLAARGGLGVSTMAINLGITLRRKQRSSVIVAEYRPGYGGISMDLGYPNAEGLVRLLKAKPTEIKPKAVEVQLVTHSSGVKFLLASPHPKDNILNNRVEQFSAITKQLAYMAEYVIIDLGSSLSGTAQAVLNDCDQVVVIVEPIPATVRQTRLLLANLFELGIGEGRTRVTLYNRLRSSVQLTWAQVQEELGYKIDTVFTPAPELAYQAASDSKPMVMQQPGSITAQQFEKFAAGLINQTSER
jgi:CheY-like chemotaxis protein/MinD-like ATPase involved in chromosome partitioning or flagellar assembly